MKKVTHDEKAELEMLRQFYWSNSQGDFSKVIRENKTFDISNNKMKAVDVPNIKPSGARLKTTVNHTVTQNDSGVQSACGVPNETRDMVMIGTNEKAENFYKHAVKSVRNLRTKYRQVNKTNQRLMRKAPTYTQMKTKEVTILKRQDKETLPKGG